jgi:hydrogenase/urease accessory protein HupE
MASGHSVVRVLRPGASVVALREEQGIAEVAYDYARLGVVHILGGIDHLLFVLALLLLLSTRAALVASISAFTVGHSVTLAGATLGLLRVPLRPVEAAIAMSVLLLVTEVARKSEHPTLAQRFPWLVAGGFGLLHGFGFAGALAEAGLPDQEVPFALLFFNLGVELGQLLFVLAIVMARASLFGRVRRLPVIATKALPYAMGVAAAFWTIERAAAIF